MSDIGSVATHPHAEAQCRGWIAANLPGIKVQPASSTADAARLVRDGVLRRGRVGAGRRAALRPRAAGRRHPGQRGRGDPLRRGRPARRAAGADRCGPHHAGRLHRRRPPGRAARDPHRVRRPRGQPDPDRVAARPARGWAATASPSTPRATSRTRGSARPCRRCTGSARTSASSAPTRAPTRSRRRPSPVSPTTTSPRQPTGCGASAADSGTPGCSDANPRAVLRPRTAVRAAWSLRRRQPQRSPWCRTTGVAAGR